MSCIGIPCLGLHNDHYGTEQLVVSWGKLKLFVIEPCASFIPFYIIYIYTYKYVTYIDNVNWTYI